MDLSGTNGNGENKIRKVIFNEVSLVLAIAGCLFWAMNYINSPVNQLKLDIALIQKDIQVIASEHLEFSGTAHERDKSIIEMGKQIERILTILEER
jgi:hypothetical protein